MRSLIPILLAVVVLSSGCDPDGYSCNSEECYADDNNPQYQTLEDCNSLCNEPKPGGCGSPVLHEGYLYSTVQIGDQCWFAENCRYLPEVSPSSEWSATDPYYYVYDFQETNVTAAKATSNYETYGVLYNLPALLTENICPSGWHISTDDEFHHVIELLGGDTIAGGKMKEIGYEHWWTPNEGATNSSGFNGLPGGMVVDYGFDSQREYGYWWSSNGISLNSFSRELDTENTGINTHVNNSSLGFSARCVRD